MNTIRSTGQNLATDKRIVGFINKASDGLPPPYFCFGNDTEVRLCKALWKRHAVTRELFQTRPRWPRRSASNGAPITSPAPATRSSRPTISSISPNRPDDLLALDIEEDDPTQWMSLEDAEEFVRQVHRRLGRFPVLYTNGTTAQLSPRTATNIPSCPGCRSGMRATSPTSTCIFPMGNWQGYALWQFSSQANCSDRRCPYRVAGTPTDIDVNVAPMNAEALRRRWPFGGLVDVPLEQIAAIPLPIARSDGLDGPVELAYATVAKSSASQALAAAFQTGTEAAAGLGAVMPGTADTAAGGMSFAETISTYLVALGHRLLGLGTLVGDAPELDGTMTGSVSKTDKD